MANFETDSLISQYLKKDDKPSKSSSSTTLPDSIASDALINRYMNGPRAETKGAAPTGYNAATGETTYEKPSEVATGSHGPSITDVPVNAAYAGGRAIKEGILEAGAGLGETLSGQPASGLGKVGMGALRVVGSPAEAISQGAGDITGNKRFADTAGDVAGLVVPVVPGAGAVKGTIKALPTNKALRDITEAIGPENAGNVAAAMRADPRLTPADLSPSVQQSAQKLYVTEGDKAKRYISEAVNQRQAGALQAVNDAMDASLGIRVNPVQKLEQLKQQIVNVGSKAIEPALSKTKPVDLSPVVKHIDNILKPGVMEHISNPENLLPYDRVQKTLQNYKNVITNDAGVVLTDPVALNKIQAGIRRQAESLLKNPNASGEDKALGHALYSLRNQFIEAIGKAGPQTVDKAGNPISEYRAALSKYRDENDVADAFRHGHDSIIKNSRNLEDDPEFFKDWVKNATPEEKEAAKQGANIAIRSAMNAYRAPVTNPTSKAQQMAQVSFNRERIESLFGKEQADRIFNKLENERKIAETNNRMVEGSQTAMRMGADSRVALPTPSTMQNIAPYAAEAAGVMASGLPGVGTLGYQGAKLGLKFKDKIATALAKERNSQFAQYALPTEAPKREELIRHLEAVSAAHNTPKLSVMNKGRLLFNRTP